MSSRFFITLPDPSAARGSDSGLSFTAHGAEAFARELLDALASPALFERWRAHQTDLAIDLEVDTSLPGAILRQRLRWLAGSAWQLRDVSGT